MHNHWMKRIGGNYSEQVETQPPPTADPYRSSDRIETCKLQNVLAISETADNAHAEFSM